MNEHEHAVNFVKSSTSYWNRVIPEMVSESERVNDALNAADELSTTDSNPAQDRPLR